MTILSTGLTAAGQISQGRAADDAAKYNARVDENRATEVQNRAISLESEERQKAAEFRGRQRAILAARGVSVDTGTALRIQEDTELLGEINAMRIRESTESQVGALETSASLTRSQGRSALRQGALGGFATVAAGAGRVADKWHQFNPAPA